MSRFRYRQRLSLEPLENRWLCVGDLHNPLIGQDVNDDGAVSPIDALQVINYLSRRTSSSSAIASSTNPSYVDVNGDGATSPIDVLQVINYLARRAPERELVTSTNASGLVRGHLELSNATLTIAKVRIDQGTPFELFVDEKGNFAFDAGGIGALRHGVSKITMYLADSAGGNVLRQLTMDFPSDRVAQLIVPDFTDNNFLDSEELKVTLIDGAFAVQGTESDNQIRIQEFRNSLLVNGVQLNLSITDLNFIGVTALGGDDKVDVVGSSEDRDILTIIDGGKGNDRLYGAPATTCKSRQANPTSLLNQKE